MWTVPNLVPFKRCPSIHRKWGERWYALSRTDISGPIFFHTTVNIDTYLGFFQE
jgi:hypothetical protein